MAKGLDYVKYSVIFCKSQSNFFQYKSARYSYLIHIIINNGQIVHY